MVIFIESLYKFYLGNVYISDWNNRIRKVTVSTGIISTIAGTGAYGYTGDGGAATSATFRSSQGIALDSIGINFTSYSSFSKAH